jgi:spore maturation protein CgeB
MSDKYNVLAVSGLHYENMAKVYSISKIGFNKSINKDLNMRIFEIMSCGTMLLTDKINNGMNDLFVNKKHLVMYENEEELNELVQCYLENEEEREKIAREGQKEVHAKHTYEHRAKQILKTVKV